MSKKLGFMDYDFERYGYMEAPPPSLNGGLYTGEPFYQDAPYRNFPVSPDTNTYIEKNLKNGNDPPEHALHMLPPTRRGNSYVDWSSLQKYEGTVQNWGGFNMYCPALCIRPEQRCHCDQVCPNQNYKHCNSKNCIRKKNEAEKPSETFRKYAYFL